MIKTTSVFKNLDKKEWTICLNNAPAEGYLYSFEQDEDRMRQHMGWIRGKGTKKRNFRVINTDKCLQFVRMDKDKKLDQWIFVGAFHNAGEIKDVEGNDIYNLQLIEDYKEYKDRLIIKFKKGQGSKQAKISIDAFLECEIVSILERPYIDNAYPFPGYTNLSIDFSQLKKIIDQNMDNWRELLVNTQCVYCITDKSNGNLYVGSTYNSEGIWNRWKCYSDTNGHGNDVELKKLIEQDPDYANKHFKFTILEPFFNTKGKDSLIREREQYWAKVFLTQSFGNYNKNLYK